MIAGLKLYANTYIQYHHGKGDGLKIIGHADLSKWVISFFD
jgi:hypothetical protein